MDIFEKYLLHINDSLHRTRTEEILNWVTGEFPHLEPRIAWNQPMFTNHGMFIIGFSVAKHHLAVAPERAVIIKFSDEIVQAGYSNSKELIRIKWDSPINFTLLDKIIRFNICEKKDCLTFWRKEEN